MRCSKTTISKGGGWEGVQAMNLFGGGGVEFEFFRGRPDPSHDLFRSAHVSHVYFL